MILVDERIRSVEDRFAFIDFYAQYGVHAVSDECISSGVDHFVREINQEVRRVIVIRICLESVVALMDVSGRNHEIHVFLAVTNTASYFS